MNFLIVLAGLATIFGCGYGVQSLLSRRRGGFNMAERVALSWLFGTGVTSMLIWILGFIVKGPLLSFVVLAIVVGFAITGYRRHRSFSPALLANFSIIEWFLLLILAAEILITVYLSCLQTLGWDGLLNWEIKARYAFENGGVLPASYLHDAGRRFSHQEYPLCIPFTELWLYLWLGAPHQFWAKLIFPIYYISGVILLAAMVARLTRRRVLGLAAAALLFLVPQITATGGGAMVGYADFPLSVYYLAAIAYLLRAAQEDGDTSSLHAYAACLALLPWVKREGAILWLVAAFCGALLIFRTARSRWQLLLLLPGVALLGAWHFYLHAMRASASTEFLPLNLETMRVNLQRAWPIIHGLGAQFADLKTWSLFWLLVAVAAVQCLRCVRQLPAAILLIALCCPIFFYAFAYIFSIWPDYLLHLHVSVSRLLMHMAPLGLLMASLAASGRFRPSSSKVIAPSCAAADCERTPAVEFA